MSWIDPVSTAVSAATVANDVARSSSFIRRHAKRIVRRLKAGTVAIPIFGCGGTGKTTGARLVAGEDPLDITAAYEASTWLETMDLPGDVPGQLLVGPGQEDRARRHWPGLYEAVVSGRSLGILNVVSYGYHSFTPESYKSLPHYTNGMGVEAFMQVYCAHRRDVEVEMLRRIVAGLSAARKDFWMITLVNKQDLWWDRRDEVRAYYETGPYSGLIDSIRRRLGDRAFQHEFIPVSLNVANMVTRDGEVLATTVGGYDMPTHLSYLKLFFGTLHGLLEQSA